MDKHAMGSLVRDHGRFYPKNTVIFYENEPGDEVFFIVKGEVSITTAASQTPGASMASENHNRFELTLLKPGDVFGEMAVLSDQPRSATATAMIDTEVVVFNTDNFYINLERYSKLAVHFLKMFANRFRRLDQQFKESLNEKEAFLHWIQDLSETE